MHTCSHVCIFAKMLYVLVYEFTSMCVHVDMSLCLCLSICESLHVFTIACEHVQSCRCGSSLPACIRTCMMHSHVCVLHLCPFAESVRIDGFAYLYMQVWSYVRIYRSRQTMFSLFILSVSLCKSRSVMNLYVRVFISVGVCVCACMYVHACFVRASVCTCLVETECTQD